MFKRAAIGMAMVASLGVSILSFTDGARSQGYDGVGADGSGEPPRSGALRKAKGRLITWLGFQMRADGGSRFFLQMTQKPEFSVKKSEGRIEILLQSARIYMRNNRRPLETRFFSTPVLRSRLRGRGRDVAWIFEMKSQAHPQISTGIGAGDYHFLYADFRAELTPR